MQGPTGDDDKIESWKVWTMEMLMNDGDISMTMMSGPEQANRDNKKFLYARVTLKPCNTIPYTTNNGETTGSQ